MQRSAQTSSLMFTLLASAACVAKPDGRAGDAAVPPASVASASSESCPAVQIVQSPAPQAGGVVPIISIDASPELSIGNEDAGEQYQLHRVMDAIRFSDGRIAVSNSGTNEIRLFDKTGRFMKSVGRRGAGPGEFAQYSSGRMFTSGDSIIALDDGIFRLHVYDANMQFAETRTFAPSTEVLRPFMRGVFANKSWLVLSYAGGGRLSGSPGSVLKSQYTLHHFDSHGRKLRDVTTVESPPRYVHQFGDRIHYPFIPLVAEPLDAVSGNELLVLRGSKPELEVFNGQGCLVRTMRWSRPLTRTKDIWAKYKAESLAGMDAQQRASYEHYFGLELPLPEFAPSYSAMVVDTRQRVWLRRFQLNNKPAAAYWDILDTGGAWIGSAQTPTGFTPYRIGNDYMLGRQLDSLGTEQVRLLRTH